MKNNTITTSHLLGGVQHTYVSYCELSHYVCVSIECTFVDF